MGYNTGTITDANPSNAFSEVFKTIVGGAGVANWSFVENIPAGTGAGQSGSASYSCDVFKCAGSGSDANDAGHDFYVGILRQGTTTSSGLRIITSEDYNDTTKKFYNWPHYRAGDNASPIGTDANGYATYSSPTYYSSAEAKVSEMVGVNYSHSFVCTINTTGFSYWIYITNNFVIFSTRVSTTDKAVYIGLMDSLIDSETISEHCPLVIVGNGENCGVSTTAAAFSNYPGVLNLTAGVYTYFGRGYLLPWTNNSSTLAGVSNATGAGDKWQVGKIHVTRGVMVNHCASGSYAVCGFTRGLLKKEVLFFPTGGTVVLGDTLAIGGETWTVVGSLLYTSLHAIVRSA